MKFFDNESFDVKLNGKLHKWLDKNRVLNLLELNTKKIDGSIENKQRNNDKS